MAAFVGTSKGTEKRRISVFVKPKAVFSIKELDDPSSDPILTINIGGEIFQTYQRTLERYPDSLLGDKFRRGKFWNKDRQEYYFNRNRIAFNYILYFYQSAGELHQPACMPLHMFIREVKFFELPKETVDQLLINNGIKSEEKQREQPKNRYLKIMWNLLEHPDTSREANIFGIVSVIIIGVSLFLIVLESIPQFTNRGLAEQHGNDTSAVKERDPDEHDTYWLRNLNSVIIIWFTIEFLLRFIACPSKRKFLVDGGNIIDFFSIFPYYVFLFLDPKHATSMSVIRVLRVFRILKLARHSRGLQMLANTLKASSGEFFMLGFFMMIIVLVCSTLLFFTEKSDPNTKFKSIPESAWFVLASLMTVGYGDLAPSTLSGKMVGSVTVLFGIILMALPIPSIVSNFIYYRDIERNRRQVEKVNKLYKSSRKESLPSCEHLESKIVKDFEGDNVSIKRHYRKL